MLLLLLLLTLPMCTVATAIYKSGRASALFDLDPAGRQKEEEWDRKAAFNAAAAAARQRGCLRPDES